MRLLGRKKSSSNVNGNNSKSSIDTPRRSTHSRKSSSSNAVQDAKAGSDAPPTLPPLVLTPLYDRFATTKSEGSGDDDGGNATGIVNSSSGKERRDLGLDLSFGMVLSGILADDSKDKEKSKDGGRNINISRPIPLGQLARTSTGTGATRTSEANFGATASVSRNGAESISGTQAGSNGGSAVMRSSISGNGGSSSNNGIGNTSLVVQSSHLPAKTKPNPYLPPDQIQQASTSKKSSSFNNPRKGGATGGVGANTWQLNSDTDTDTDTTETEETTDTDMHVYGAPDSAVVGSPASASNPASGLGAITNGNGNVLKVVPLSLTKQTSRLPTPPQSPEETSSSNVNERVAKYVQQQQQQQMQQMQKHVQRDVPPPSGTPRPREQQQQQPQRQQSVAIGKTIGNGNGNVSSSISKGNVQQQQQLGIGLSKSDTVPPPNVHSYTYNGNGNGNNTPPYVQMQMQNMQQYISPPHTGATIISPVTSSPMDYFGQPQGQMHQHQHQQQQQTFYPYGAPGMVVTSPTFAHPHPHGAQAMAYMPMQTPVGVQVQGQVPYSYSYPYPMQGVAPQQQQVFVASPQMQQQQQQQIQTQARVQPQMQNQMQIQAQTQLRPQPQRSASSTREHERERERGHGHRKKNSLDLHKSRTNGSANGSPGPSPSHAATEFSNVNPERGREIEHERSRDGQGHAKLRKKYSKDQWVAHPSPNPIANGNGIGNSTTVPSSFQLPQQKRSHSQIRQQYQIPTPPTSRDGHTQNPTQSQVPSPLTGSSKMRDSAVRVSDGAGEGRNRRVQIDASWVEDNKVPLARITSQKIGAASAGTSQQHLMQTQPLSISRNGSADSARRIVGGGLGSNGSQRGKPLIFAATRTASWVDEFEDVEPEKIMADMDAEIGMKSFVDWDDEGTVTRTSRKPERSLPVPPVSFDLNRIPSSASMYKSESSENAEWGVGQLDGNGGPATNSTNSKSSTATIRPRKLSNPSQSSLAQRPSPLSDNSEITRTPTIRLVNNSISSSGSSSSLSSLSYSPSITSSGKTDQRKLRKLQKAKMAPTAPTSRPSTSDSTRSLTKLSFHSVNDSVNSLSGNSNGRNSKTLEQLPRESPVPIDLATGEEMAPDADPFARIVDKPVIEEPISPVQVFSNPTTSVKNTTPTSLPHKQSQSHIRDKSASQPELPIVDGNVKLGERSNTVRRAALPPTPITPEEFLSTSRTSRTRERIREVPTRSSELVKVTAVAKDSKKHSRKPSSDEIPRNVDSASEYSVSDQEAEPESKEPPSIYPLSAHLSHPVLLASLLSYFNFRDWCNITELNDALRRSIEHKRELREVVLERFLTTVGYVRWKSQWGKTEPVMLTFKDLNAYMRCVSTPSHEYAKAAKAYLNTKKSGTNEATAIINKSLLASSCRSYSRVVMRLRAQAEAMVKEAEDAGFPLKSPPSDSSVVRNTSSITNTKSRSRPPSRAPSPTSSNGHHSNPRNRDRASGNPASRSPSEIRRPSSSRAQSLAGFQSTLYRVGHAPLLRVFIPSPEGEWLSDESVLNCEKELKRAGVMSLLKLGDVVWDAAVGDEGNVGRLVWDGNYLIDLDYTYSQMGELPKYLHSLAFPPSYFHRVIRTTGNPICYIDLSPWSEEIAANLQLLQDRMKTDTPQGGHHTVVRWIHRTKFRIRSHGSPAIPDAGNLSIDPAWWGTVVVETEGTNEGLADLQDRCSSAFPERAGADLSKPVNRVFRLLRERSRPGEIWIRLVRDKERLI